MGPYREALQKSARPPESLYQGGQEWLHLDRSGGRAQEKPCSMISALEGQKNKGLPPSYQGVQAPYNRPLP